MVQANIEKLKEKISDKKIRVNVTMTGSLYTRINKFKDKHEIKMFSPFIEAMVEEWLDEAERIDLQVENSKHRKKINEVEEKKA